MRATVAILAGLLAAGCSAGGGSAHVVPVTEKDFRISAPAQVAAGDVSLAVRNRGPISHELIIVKEGTAPLPLRGDGLTVDEDAVEARTALAVEPQQAGTQTVARVHLTPGRYVLFCNMAGHYLGGMRAELDVR
jgi:uncharacterized cupredoxin-like copper-binding protein